MKIVTTSKVQKNISILSDTNNIYTVVNRGEPRTMIVPYSEELQEMLEDYIENMEIYSNKDKLKKQMQESLDSGLSNFVI